jgi:hypothetical protein
VTTTAAGDGHGEPVQALSQLEPPSAFAKFTLMASDSSAGKTETVRGRIAQAAEQNYEALERFFQDALNAEKSVSARCDNCHRIVTIAVPDWVARNKVVDTMLNQGFGRPPAESAGGGGELVVIRRLVLPDGFELDAGLPGTLIPPPSAGR